MKRADILAKAKQCVCGEREGQYGSPENNFKRIASLWSAYMDHDYTATDVAMMMALLKIARIKTGTATEDSFVDLAGYAACGGEITTEKPISGKYKWNSDTIKTPEENDIFHFINISFTDWSDANLVLNAMGQIMAKYGVVSVDDFYTIARNLGNAANIVNNPVHSKYGWYDLGDAEISTNAGVYKILFPEVKKIK